MKEVFYKERCNGIRHYSAIVMDYRKLIVTQGFVVIGACGILYGKDYFGAMGYLAVFGCFLTFVLSCQAKNDVDFLVSFLEQRDCTDCIEDGTDPWCGYWIARKDKLRNWWKRIFILYGPSIVIFAGFVFIFLVAHRVVTLDRMHADNYKSGMFKITCVENHKTLARRNPSSDVYDKISVTKQTNSNIRYTKQVQRK